MRFFCIAAMAYPYIDLLPPTMCGLTELKSTLGLSYNGIRTCLAPGSNSRNGAVPSSFCLRIGRRSFSLR